MLADLLRDGRVDRAVEGGMDLKADDRLELTDERHDGRSNAVPASRRSRARRWRIGIWRMVSSMSATAVLSRAAIPLARAAPAMLWRESPTANRR